MFLVFVEVCSVFTSCVYGTHMVCCRWPEGAAAPTMYVWRCFWYLWRCVLSSPHASTVRTWCVVGGQRVLLLLQCMFGDVSGICGGVFCLHLMRLRYAHG